MGTILSRIRRWYFDIAYLYGSKLVCCQKVERFSHTGNLKRDEQAAKSNRTLNVNNDQRRILLPPRDLTAYGFNNLNLMRRRSLHSSSTKGDSLNSLTSKTIDNSRLEEFSRSDKPVRAPGGKDATTIAKNLLEQIEQKNQKYFNLIDIIANPHFLEKCYSEIRSKPGNMTKGITDETLDKLN